VVAEWQGFLYAAGLQFSFPGYLNPHAPAAMYAAMGKNGQFINIVPGMNLVYIRMGDPPGSSALVPFTINDTIWQKLNDVFCNATSIHPIGSVFSIEHVPESAQENFTVEFPGQNYDVILSDAMGRIVFSKSKNTGKNRNQFVQIPTRNLFSSHTIPKNIHDK
jgi:hypothetical protein